MSAGSLTMACLLLVTGQAPADTVYFNQRAMKIPIDIQPARRHDLKEFLLYVSSNQGRTWDRYASELPDKEFFTYRAAADGEYWFRIAAINAQGKQDPENVYAGPPQQKVKIDTVHKPSLRLVAAKRVGDELVVSWEALTEIPPDAASMKLEYRMLDGSSTVWFPVPLTPESSGVARARLFGPGRVAVRMQFRDVAGNVARAEAVEIPAAEGAPGVVAGGPVSPYAQPRQPAGTIDVGVQANSSPAGQNPLPPPPGPVMPANHATGPLPPAPLAVSPPKLADPPSVAQTPPGPGGARGLTNLPAPGAIAPERGPGQPQPSVGVDCEAPVATTTQRPQVPAPVAPPSAADLNPRHAPPVQLVNTREVSLEYQLSKLGPSGVKSVVLYVTPDGGKSWNEFEDEKPDLARPVVGSKYQRTLTLPPGEGVYGLILVVRNGGNLGRPKPRPGEAPEMVVEVDLTPPYAKLWAPQADAEHREAVVLKWTAQDKNLAERPVTLEWASKLPGPWQVIATDLPGTGTHSWPVPAGTPVQVYLRLRVQDRAGNEAVAITDRPQTIDLVEPEGHLVRVLPVTRP